MRITNQPDNFQKNQIYPECNRQKNTRWSSLGWWVVEWGISISVLIKSYDSDGNESYASKPLRLV